MNEGVAPGGGGAGRGSMPAHAGNGMNGWEFSPPLERNVPYRSSLGSCVLLCNHMYKSSACAGRKGTGTGNPPTPFGPTIATLVSVSTLNRRSCNNKQDNSSNSSGHGRIELSGRSSLCDTPPPKKRRNISIRSEIDKGANLALCFGWLCKANVSAKPHSMYCRIISRNDPRAHRMLSRRTGAGLSGCRRRTQMA